MTRWQIVVALGLICVSAALGAPRFGRRHEPPGPPPEFEKYLPKDVFDKLKSIHADHSLKWEEKMKMINDVFDSVAPEILEKLPPPPGFDKLPQEIQDQLKKIHSDRSLKWSEKMEKGKVIIEALPEEQRRLLPFPFGRRGPFGPGPFGPGPFGPGHFRGFPPMPPPGFKDVLPEETYNELISIHQDKNMSESEKKNKIDQVMSKVPSDILAKLPLPPNFEKLPQEIQDKAREILHNFSLGFDERHRKLFELIESLPEDQKELVRPPFPFGHGWGKRGGFVFPPPDFKEVLPADVYSKLEEINKNKDLSWTERWNQIDEVMKKLPKETLDKLPLPPHLRGLPEDVKVQIKAILRNYELSHWERKQQIRDLIDNLPEDIKRLVPPHPFGPFGPRGKLFPMGPPPDFKEHLPTDVWEKLNAIHANKNLSRQERRKQIDELMNTLPTETLLKLPLPPHLRRLPKEAQDEIHKIFADKTKSFEEKMRATKDFIKTLPKDQRRLARPYPPGFENLPDEYKKQIEAVFENDDLHCHERFEKIREIMESLPEEIRQKLPPPPPPFDM